MKLEVLINETDPKIYSLDKDKIVIGSNENSHIIINDPSISRKHAIIFIKDDQFFISDQGSINGTFIGDEALTPGKRAEMSIYSPVRLGANVLLTLITEEEAAELEEVLPLNEFEVQEKEEKTQVISYAELKKMHTEELQKKRASDLTERKKKVKKKKKKAFPWFRVFVFVAAAVIFYRDYNQKRERNHEERKPVAEVETKVGPIERLGIDALIAPELLVETFKKPKCSGNFGKLLCSLLPTINHKNFGPVVVDKNIIIFADSDSVIPQAKEYLRNKQPNERELHVMALILWINKNITERLKEIKDIDDYRITIALVNHSKEETSVLFNSVFAPSALLQLKERLTPEHFEKAKQNGFLEFYYYVDYGRYNEG